MENIGFVGGGNMAEALIKGIIHSGVYKPANIFVCDIKADRLSYLSQQYGIRTVKENAILTECADIIVLSVKPQDMAEALDSIKGHIMQGTLLISIAAGIRTGKITDVLGDVAIMRVMPNMPALISEGVSAMFATKKAEPMLAKAEKIFSAAGLVVTVNDETLLDAVTAVSGSGPAYYFLLMEAMIEAATKLGLTEDVSRKLVIQTAKGASLLAAASDKDGQPPAVLRRKVTSPGGTTQAALAVFERHGFAATVTEALQEACNRSRELSN